jgi:uncharacterized protein YciI
MTENRDTTMFIVLLRFSNGKSKARDLVAAHNEWIERGFENGVFLVVGSLQPGLGGTVVAHNTTREALEARVQNDPFVTHDVVTAEILEVSLTKKDPRLTFVT